MKPAFDLPSSSAGTPPARRLASPEANTRRGYPGKACKTR